MIIWSLVNQRYLWLPDHFDESEDNTDLLRPQMQKVALREQAKQAHKAHTVCSKRKVSKIIANNSKNI